MKEQIVAIAILAALGACSKPQPTHTGKSYYQREMDRQVAADDPARPQRLNAEQFRNTTRQHNPHDYREDVGEAIDPHKHQILDIFGRAVAR